MGIEFAKDTLGPLGDSYGNGLTGVETMDRADASLFSSMTASGRLFLSFFTPQVTRSVQTWVAYCGATAAATVTLIRFGLYSVASNGDLTLVASTANDTGLFAATNAEVTKAMAAPYTVAAGQRYAAGLLVVATTVPSVLGAALANSTVMTSLNSRAPRVTGLLTGLSDLSASIAAGTLSGTGVRFYYGLV